MKENKTIRFEPDQLARAEKLGIDVAEICRDALDLEIHLRLNATLAVPGVKRNNFIANFFAIKRLRMGVPKK